MDKAADTKTLEDQKTLLLQWRDHPFTKELFQANAEAQNSMIELLCSAEVTNMETFFAHFTAVGHLRGLRQLPNAFNETLADINAKINEL